MNSWELPKGTCWKCEHLIEPENLMAYRNSKSNEIGTKGVCRICWTADCQWVRFRQIHNVAEFEDPRHAFNFDYKAWRKKLTGAGGICPSCGKKGKLAMDHVIALRDGGSPSVENIEPLCQPCNSRKGVKEKMARLNRAA